METPQTPTTPAAPATPPVVNYVSDDAMVRVKVDGRESDIKVGDMKRGHQMMQAAERRLADANALRTAHAADIQVAERISSLALRLGVDPTLVKTNPEAAMAEMAKRFAGNAGGGGGAHNPAENDDGADPNTKALRSQIATMQQQMSELTRQFTTTAQQRSTEQKLSEIRSELGALPLYQEHAAFREDAEVVVAAMLANARANGRPEPSVRELVGELHARHAIGLTEYQNKTRDTRTGALKTTTSANPDGSSPVMSIPEIAKPTKEQMAADPNWWRKSLQSWKQGAINAGRPVR